VGTIGQEQSSLLTVDFHEGGLLSGLNGDNALTLQKGFWFQLSGQDRQRAREPWGPANPQALNRYAYVLDNPVRYTDPSGHALDDGSDGGDKYHEETPDVGDLRKLSDKEAKELAKDAGYDDVHELKREWLGKGARIKEYDLYVDKKTGRIYIGKKKLKKGDEPIDTGLYLFSGRRQQSGSSQAQQRYTGNTAVPPAVVITGGAILTGWALYGAFTSGCVLNRTCFATR
jgi:hypothetical protein